MALLSLSLVVVRHEHVQGALQGLESQGQADRPGREVQQCAGANARNGHFALSLGADAHLLQPPVQNVWLYYIKDAAISIDVGMARLGVEAYELRVRSPSDPPPGWQRACRAVPRAVYLGFLVLSDPRASPPTAGKQAQDHVRGPEDHAGRHGAMRHPMHGFRWVIISRRDTRNWVSS